MRIMVAPQHRPTTQEREAPEHRCGRCNNGTGVRNPDCPNRPAVS